MYWPDDDTWYSGALQDYDGSTGHHRVLYDDGEWEFVHLHEQDLSFLTEVSLTDEKEEVEEEEGGGVAGTTTTATTSSGGGGDEEEKVEEGITTVKTLDVGEEER